MIIEGGILKVSELKKLLSKYSDDTQLVFANDDWYENITEIVEPDEDTTFAITFYTSKTFDPRQF